MRYSSRLLGAVLLLVPPLASTQESSTEHVLVTATRVSEDGAKIPMAWSSISEKELELIGEVHINQVMQQVPGAWIARGNGQESLISLRSPVLTGAGSCGAFLTAGDGISLRAPGFCNVNQLFDANTEQAGRIEVIKGPATSVYGSNAMHGLINVLSAAPTAEEDQNVSVEAGPYDYYRGKYRYGNTWGAHGVSVRINGTTDGGYLDDAGYDQQKATLRYDFEDELWRISNVFDYANLNQETAGYIQGYNIYKDNSERRDNPNPEAYRDARSIRFHSAISRTLDQANTLTITPYLRDNEMKFLQHFLPWQPVEKNEHSSLGLRAALNTDLQDSSWANGVEVEYTDGRLKETQAEDFSPNQPAGVHYDYQVDATVAAAFSQWRTALNTDWELSAGARVEYTYYDYDNKTGDGSACSPEASACRFYRPSDRDDDFTDWSANGGVGYSLNADTIAYLRLARGFRAPQTAELYRLQSGQEEADLDSEELSNVELGLRGVGERLEYDLSVYLMHKDNVIFQDANRFNVSGAKTRHYGAELSLDYRLSEELYFRLDGTWANHTYDSDINLLGSDGNINGNTIDTAPELFGSARAGWNFPSMTDAGGTLELEWVYMDSYYLDPGNEHEYSGHSLFNLRATTMVSQHWRGTLRITNLLDKDYAERADFGFGEYRYFVGQPRGAYLEISYQFGS